MGRTCAGGPELVCWVHEDGSRDVPIHYPDAGSVRWPCARGGEPDSRSRCGWAVQNGETVDSVTRAQVYECLAYYEDHLAEVDYLIARQMAEASA